jgi:peroxiredoxin
MTTTPHTLVRTALALALTLAVASTASAGGRAPDFQLRDLDGQTVSLADFRDKVIVISFWATWCGPCKAEMPHLQKLHDDYASQGLVILSVSVDEARDEPKAKAQIRAGGYTYPVLLDQDKAVITLFNPRGTVPFAVVIGRDGTIHSKHEGYAPGDEVKLKAEVEALLGIGDAPGSSD